ncbi:DsbA family protein [Lichenihabitans psoromatis]|uniref:DsbA family protein n=1 Tax=Lichenihabitans psoromatis TaxID=2528642 RepID=UPI0010383CA3|nr:DsbA family protein [Lichenihabitans psoromatis]
MVFSKLNRRTVLRGAALAGVAASAGSVMLLDPGSARAATEGASYPVDQLMAEGQLPDIWLGARDAPVTIIEYASMTCTHCAAFATETYPTLKSKYIDTGKVRFTLREFPLDPLATAGFMLARCAGPDKRMAMVDLLFAQQKNWAFVDKPVEALANTVKQAGISQTDFETCLKDQKLYDQVNAVRDNAAQKFAVDATPTFYINGKKQAGEMTVTDLDKILEPLLPKG